MYMRQIGRGRGRGGGRGNNGWQKKMLTKLVKDEGAVFQRRDVQAFLQGMRLFDSKAELVSLLADDRNCGLMRIRDCLSFLSDDRDVDGILVPLLSNIINAETGRPLYKVSRDKLVREIFFIPGLIEFLASTWAVCINQSTEQTIESIAEFLLVATMSSIEARSSSDHVKIIACEMRDSSIGLGSQIIRRLCAIIHLDPVESNQSRKTIAEKPHKVVCWGSDVEPPGGRHDNDHENFRDIALVPTQDELAYEGKPFLPLATGDNAVIADAGEALLDRNFRLLREDAVGTMRENMTNPRTSKVWSNARIIGASCKDAFNPKRTSCLHFLVQFDLPQRKVNWSVGRALPRDGLVVLKRDGVAPMMATVFIRNDKEKNSWLNSPGGPIIGLVFHHSKDINTVLNDVCANSSVNEEFENKIELMRKIEPNQRVAEHLHLLKRRFVSYTLTEASDSFSYRPVLEALKDKTSVPLAQDIVLLKPTTERPSYLPQNVRMPFDFGSLACNLEEWSNEQVVESTSLDISQTAALKLALTSRVALIQGPPG